MPYACSIAAACTTVKAISSGCATWLRRWIASAAFPSLASRIRSWGPVESIRAWPSNTHAFEQIKPADIVNVGVYRGDKDNMVEENAAIVRDILCCQASPKERVAIHLEPVVLDRYVGRYELTPGVFFNLRRDDGKMMAQLTGQGYCEILNTVFLVDILNSKRL